MKPCIAALVSSVLVIVGAGVALAAPSEAELRRHLPQRIYAGPACLGEILPGKDPGSAAEGLKNLGVPPASARALVGVCRRPYDKVASDLLLEALDGASDPASEGQVVVGRIVEALLARHVVAVEGERRREVLSRLPPARAAFVEAVLADGEPGQLEKFERAASLAPDDPEKRLCYADALLRVERTAEAEAALASPPPGSDGRVVAALRAIALAQRGAYQQAKDMVASIPTPTGGGPAVYACNIQPDDARCTVTWIFVQAKAYDAAIDVAGPFCGASVAEAYQELGRTFDAYVALRRDSFDDPLAAAKLVAALGRPDVAREHLSWPLERCRSAKKEERPADEKERAECEQILAFVATLPEAEAPSTVDPELRRRLAEKPLASSYQEVPAPKGERRAGPPFDIPGACGPVLFTALEGERGLAALACGDLDPKGELSMGGVVLYLSDDGGKRWDGPFHTGFALGFPYYVRRDTAAPVFAGDVIQLPVDHREIDPDSITFPPVSLRAKRTARDRLVRIPLSILRRDQDGDGLTDLVEERLATDWTKADTDGDGTPDGVDDAPLTKPVNDPRARFVGAVIEEKKMVALVHEPGGSMFPTPAPERQADRPTRFVEASFPLSGLPGRTIALNGAAWQLYRKKFGPVYPTKIEVVTSPDGKRAVVDLDERWRRAVYLVEEKADGSMAVEQLTAWIT